MRMIDFTCRSCNKMKFLLTDPETEETEIETVAVIVEAVIEMRVESRKREEEEEVVDMMRANTE